MVTQRSRESFVGQLFERGVLQPDPFELGFQLETDGPLAGRSSDATVLRNRFSSTGSVMGKHRRSTVARASRHYRAIYRRLSAVAATKLIPSVGRQPLVIPVRPASSFRLHSGGTYADHSRDYPNNIKRGFVDETLLDTVKELIKPDSDGNINEEQLQHAVVSYLLKQSNPGHIQPTGMPSLAFFRP